jgi:hypothetical protein
MAPNANPTPDNTIAAMASPLEVPFQRQATKVTRLKTNAGRVRYKEATVTQGTTARPKPHMPRNKATSPSNVTHHDRVLRVGIGAIDEDAPGAGRFGGTTQKLYFDLLLNVYGTDVLWRTLDREKVGAQSLNWKGCAVIPPC